MIVLQLFREASNEVLRALYMYMSITSKVMDLDYTTHALFLFAVCSIAIRRPTPIFHTNLVSSEFQSTLMYYQSPETHTKLIDGLTLYI